MVATLLVALAAQAQTVSDFESPRLPVQRFLNGKQVTTSGFIVSSGLTFNNSFDTAFGGIWTAGVAISNMRNDSTPGFLNMYSAASGSGYNSQNYAVAQSGTRVLIPGNRNVLGVYVTNSAYAYFSMKNGDIFAKKFGGTSGNDPDSFVLVTKGYLNGNLISEEVRYTLADFRPAGTSQDYIRKDWDWLDLSALADADSLEFFLESSDNGDWGMNTPAFFCLDDFTLADTSATQLLTVAGFEEVQLLLDDAWNGKPLEPFRGFARGNAFFNNSYNTTWDFWSSGFSLSNVVDTTTPGYTNQYAARAGKGVNGSDHYLVGTGGAKVLLTGAAAGKAVNGFYVTNSTYAYLSMKNGDQFGKKFGGISGTDPDYFELIVRSHKDGAVTDSVVVALADFRPLNSSEDYILDTWKWVDLLPLGNVDSLSFAFRSSDVGPNGMNTPAYFCMDDFTTKDGVSAPALITGNTDAFICAGKTFDLPYVTGDSFGAGNVFSAQLSDSLGLFGNPVIIGSVSTVNSGNITVTLPSWARGNAYKIRVVASNPAANGTPGNSFAIGARPVPVIAGDSVVTVNEPHTFSVAANPGSGYTWFYENATGTNDSSSVSITWNVTGSTELKVLETSAQGCVSDTVVMQVAVELPSGLDKTAGELRVNLFPNPASSFVSVRLPEGAGTLSVRVYDLTGRKVLESDQAEISVSGLTKGVYLLLVEAGGRSAARRLVIE